MPRVEAMADQTARIATFRALHDGPDLFLMPNPWDAGSAKLLAHLGFPALATTSSGFAATFGRLDGHVTREEVLEHCSALCEAVDVPVSADLEHGFADDPADVAETYRLALETGLAGASIEDSTKRADDPIFELALAAERVRAAVEASGSGDRRLVITARYEGFLHGRKDLGEAITHLQAYQEAGADCLFAPGVRKLEDLRTLVAEVDRPLNVLVRSGAPGIAELAELGVRRISVGGGFAYAAIGGLVDAATELLERGTYDFWDQAGRGWDAAHTAFA
jgi:2-methylisocitrate lyase-like PEP mutase family enzyme